MLICVSFTNAGKGSERSTYSFKMTEPRLRTHFLQLGMKSRPSCVWLYFHSSISVWPPVSAQYALGEWKNEWTDLLPLPVCVPCRAQWPFRNGRLSSKGLALHSCSFQLHLLSLVIHTEAAVVSAPSRRLKKAPRASVCWPCVGCHSLYSESFACHPLFMPGSGKEPSCRCCVRSCVWSAWQSGPRVTAVGQDP